MFTIDDEEPDSEELEIEDLDTEEVKARQDFLEFWSDPCWTFPIE